MISIKESGKLSLADFREVIKACPFWEKLIRKASSYGEVTLMKGGDEVYCLRVDFEHCALSFSTVFAPTEDTVEAVLMWPNTVRGIFADGTDFSEGGFYTSMDRACELIEKYNGYVPVEPPSEG